VRTDLPIASRSRTLAALAGALTLSVIGSLAQAEDSFIVGPRALGMGGANVATTDDYTAQYYNPAAFGFFGDTRKDGTYLSYDNNALGRKDWGFGVDATAGEDIQGNLGTYLNDFNNLDIDRLKTIGIQSPTDVANILRVSDDLTHAADPGNAITGWGNAGFGVRIGHVGIGVRAFAQGTAQVSDVDLSPGHLGIGDSTGAFNQQIANSGSPSDGTIQVLTPGEQAQLSPYLNTNSLQIIDYQLRQGGYSAADIQSTVNVLAGIAQGTNAGSGATGGLSANTTRVTLNGFGLLEVPVSYGHELLNDHLSVGGSLKLMEGRVYGTSVLIFQNGSTDNLATKLKDNYKQSMNFGVDLSVMARSRYLQAGLIGRNLNSPDFKGYTDQNGVHYSDVKVKPQATLGLAFVPFHTLAIEGDYDLVPAETTLGGYKDQRLSGGIEWNPGHIVALRVGAYKNTKDNAVPVVFTGGLGLNLYIMRIDLAAAVAPEHQDYQGKSYPKEAQGSGGLTVDF
jgi:hypothetical protein